MSTLLGKKAITNFLNSFNIYKQILWLRGEKIIYIYIYIYRHTIKAVNSVIVKNVTNIVHKSLL